MTNRSKWFGLGLANAASLILSLMLPTLAREGGEAALADAEGAALEPDVAAPPEDAVPKKLGKRRRIPKFVPIGGIALGVLTLVMVLGRLIRRKILG